MKFVNLTPHPIKILSERGTIRNANRTFSADPDGIEVLKEILPEEGDLPRVEPGEESEEIVEEIPVVRATGETRISNLPEPKWETVYIVSGIVAAEAARQGRSDCWSPDRLVRDENNPSSVLGCLALRKPKAR